MLGYGANKKGYCLYDLDWSRVCHSRDVAFDETYLPGIQKEKQSSPTYVELETENEPIIQEPVDSNRTAEDVTADDLPTCPIQNLLSKDHHETNKNLTDTALV